MAAAGGLRPGEKNRAEGRHPWFHWHPLEVSDEETPDYKVVDWAIGQMKRQHEKPFFLAVGIFRPHMPWHVPRKYFDMYPLETLELPEHQAGDLDDTHGHDRRDWHKWVLDHDQWPQTLQSYLASITYADAQIGRLLDGMAGSGQAANTVSWRYIRYANGDEELYNDKTDPPEYTNLAGKREYVETVM